MATATKTSDHNGSSPYALALRRALHGLKGRPEAEFRFAGLKVEVRLLENTLWALVRREGLGGIAVRVVKLIGAGSCKVEATSGTGPPRLWVRSALGEHRVTIVTDEREHALLRFTVSFTPDAALKPPFTPRDLFPLDAHDDPLGAAGVVHACQRGPNSGLVYLRL